jgi:DNA-binding protein HU-beta
MNLNKQTLVDIVSAKTGETKIKTLEAINAVINALSETLSEGDGAKATFVGFGTLETYTRKATTKRQPLTDNIINVPEKLAVRFKAGTALKQSLNPELSNVEVVDETDLTEDEVSA